MRNPRSEGVSQVHHFLPDQNLLERPERMLGGTRSRASVRPMPSNEDAHQNDSPLTSCRFVKQTPKKKPTSSNNAQTTSMPGRPLGLSASSGDVIHSAESSHAGAGLTARVIQKYEEEGCLVY